jgi:carbonic anhydrase
MAEGGQMVFRTLNVLAVVAGIAVASGDVSAQTFGYFGAAGPTLWSELNPGWSACGAGKSQSPVDFRSPHPLQSSKLSIEYGHTTGEIFNNGHTIEVETEGRNTLTLGGVVYQLVQFHFHAASEHRVEGRGFDMELHLVHASAGGSNAVIGVFLERGSNSGSLAPILRALPDDMNTKHPLDAPFDPRNFLPKSDTHFRYVGSLTTPPCTEGVQWIVMTEPVIVSDDDMARFNERIHFNARPVQRKVRASQR